MNDEPPLTFFSSQASTAEDGSVLVAFFDWEWYIDTHNTTLGGVPMKKREPDEMRILLLFLAIPAVGIIILLAVTSWFGW